MGWQATIRAQEAAERRQQRDAMKRQRELERQTKEKAKLSALEQARLEVETSENTLEVLLSVHKEQADPRNWRELASSLLPVPPKRQSHNELKIRQRLAVSTTPQDTASAVKRAQDKDESEYQDAQQTYKEEHAEWEKLSTLARRVLDGDQTAYLEAIEDLSPFSELAGIGSSLKFTVINAQLIECVLSTNGQQAIPSDAKTLTASGKVSTKPIPRSRFVEIYQDYVCGCVLRVAREIFALLPVQSLLITATAQALDTTTGQTVEKPIISVAISRAAMANLNFDKLDPSDTIMSFTHRGDLKASRKTGDFEFTTPLTLDSLPQVATDNTDLKTLLATAQRLREDLTAKSASLRPQSQEAVSDNGEP